MRILPAWAVLLVAANFALGAEVDYLRDVKPLLTEKCISCHGPLKQEADLRLDAASLIREHGTAAVAKQPDESLILHRVTAESADERMPPEGEGERLTAEQVAILRTWIEQGLPAPADEAIVARPEDHWAFQPVERPQLPADAANGANPIDLLIDALQQERGLEPFPPADKPTLLRRITLDLIGLPPTEEELQAFLADESPDAFERVVDDLLARPQYGERWGRHWMDVWRYSDWDGYKNELRGSQRHIWHWRDWIVESLNADKPYDQMVREMLAADEIAPEDPDALRATGYLARNFHKSNRNIWLDATVEHTSKAFLGLTVDCARCHDHKFDPIPQTEYYAFRAIFEPHKVRTERLPGQPDLMKEGLPRAYDADLDAATYVYLQGNEKQPDKEHPVAPMTPEIVSLPYEVKPVALPSIAAFPALRDYVRQEDISAAENRVEAARNAFEKAAESEPSPETRRSRHADRPPSVQTSSPFQPDFDSARLKLAAAERALESLHQRWDADIARHDSSRAATEAEQDRLASQASVAEREAALAAARSDALEKWLALQKARDGKESDATKRQKAIDAATAAFEKSRETRDKAHAALTAKDAKYTPVGESYPSTSTGRRLALAEWITDPRNPLAARVAVNHIWMRHFGEPLVENVFDFGLRSPRPVQAKLLDWLAADLIEHGWLMKRLHRQIVTSDAYRRASGGHTALTAHNSAIDADNRYLWRFNVQRLQAEVIRDSMLAVAGQLDRTLGGPDIEYAKGEEVPRRSLYFQHAYEKQMTMLTLFDAANPTDCYRRSPSVIPQQALVLANSPLSLAMSRRLAQQLSETADDNAAFITAAFRRVLTRDPTETERTACSEFLARQEQLLTEPAKLTPFDSEDKTATSASSNPALRARENLVHVLMNHNDFVTVR